MRPSGVLLVAAALLIGCSGDDRATTLPAPETSAPPGTSAPETTDSVAAPSTDVEAIDTTTTATPTTSLATTPQATTDVEPAATVPVTSNDGFDAAAVIVTIDDLGAGWTQIPFENDEEDSTEACLDEAFEDAEIFTRDDPASSEAAFESSDLILSVLVAGEYPQAEQYLAALPDLVAACDGDVDSDGGISHVLPLSFPALGDETFATRIDFESIFNVTVLTAFTRVGDVIGVGFVVGSDGAGAEVLEDVMRTMVDRM